MYTRGGEFWKAIGAQCSLQATEFQYHYMSCKKWGRWLVVGFLLHFGEQYVTAHHSFLIFTACVKCMVATRFVAYLRTGKLHYICGDRYCLIFCSGSTCIILHFHYIFWLQKLMRFMLCKNFDALWFFVMSWQEPQNVDVCIRNFVRDKNQNPIVFLIFMYCALTCLDWTCNALVDGILYEHERFL